MSEENVEVVPRVFENSQTAYKQRPFQESLSSGGDSDPAEFVSPRTTAGDRCRLDRELEQFVRA